VLAVLGAVLLWAGSFPAMKTAVAGLEPMTVMWVRMVVALCALAPFAGRLRLRFERRDFGPLAAICLLQPCLYFLLESNALRLTTSVQAGLISATVPLLVAFGGWLALGARVSGRALCGLAVSVAGVAGLTLAGGASVDAVNPALGNLLEFGAMVSVAASWIMVKRLSGRYGPWSLTGLQIAAGALFFLPGAPAVLDRWPAIMDGGRWAVLLYLGAGSTLAAFGLYNWGLSRLEAGRASSFINIVPAAAALFGWLILGETLAPLQIASALVVFAGVYLNQAPVPRLPGPATRHASRIT
jgi:drug/metabolite transporter (DMT)-like permease